ncbi:MAG: LON peptidase substrate-binding domain-containing protein [Actinomycetota bacterium]|nr:LON peptidase substrate-binding domain-containing protein [Actinomycetota bacterium]
MTEEASGELPLFELPVVLLPGELMPLHIFEERYKRMIGHCLETEEPFGVVLRDDDGSARRIGCTARVTQVLERFEDGRMDIVVTGGEPFRVLERFDGADYPAGEVEAVPPSGEDEVGDPSAADDTREAFADLVRRVSGSEPEMDGLDESDAYAIAGRVELPVLTKQRLLELRSEAERMKLLGAALRDLVRMLKRSRKIAEAAKLNGKVTFS